ncbi:MAG: hypothetical protein M3347_11735 [Armatimonadota bacterium]|nr:hypothetical protein [Armatimonadota bacterium]
MTHRKQFLSVLAAAATAAIPTTIGPAQAQPDPNNQPKGVNPPAQEMPFGRIGPRLWRRNAPPMVETNVRARLMAAGFTDKDTQDAVVAFVVERQKARQALREQGRKMEEALRADALTDAEMLTLLHDFRATVEEEKARHKTALAALDAKTGYSKKPRLQALLTLLGIIGDEASYLNDFGGSPTGGDPLLRGDRNNRIFMFPPNIVPPPLTPHQEPFMPPDNMLRVLPNRGGDGFVFAPPPPWSSPSIRRALPYRYRIPEGQTFTIPLPPPVAPAPPAPAPPAAPGEPAKPK